MLSAFITQGRGKFEKSMEEAKKAIEIDPDGFPGYGNLALDYFYVDRLDEAGNTLRRASERKLGYPDILFLEYELAFLKTDRAGLEKALATAQGKPGAEDLISGEHAFVLAYSGRLQEARRMLGHAVDLAQKAAQPDRAAQYEAGQPCWKPFPRMRPMRGRDQRRRWRFPGVGMQSTASLLPWLSRGILPGLKH